MTIYYLVLYFICYSFITTNKNNKNNTFFIVFLWEPYLYVFIDIDAYVYDFQCLPQSKQVMKIVAGSSALRVCNS